MDRRLLDWICCPDCRSENLRVEAEPADGEIVSGTLACTACGGAYRIDDGIPFLLPSLMRGDVEQRMSGSGQEQFVEYRTEATPAVARLYERLARSAKVVLDLGSGRAPYLDLFTGDVICLDIFPQFLRDLPAHTDRALVHPVCASATHVPIKAGVADLVVSSELIEHLRPDEAQRALSDWRQLANQWCVIDTPNGREGDVLTKVRHLVYRTDSLTPVSHPELPELDHHSTFRPEDFRAAGYTCRGCIGWLSRKRFRLGPLWDLYDAVAWHMPSIAGTLLAIGPGRLAARRASLRRIELGRGGTVQPPAREFDEEGVGVVGPQRELTTTEDPESGYTIDALGLTVTLANPAPALLHSEHTGMIPDPPPNMMADPLARMPRALVVTYGSVAAPDHGLAVRARSMLDALGRLGVRATVISHWEPELADTRPPDVEDLHVLRGRLHLGWSVELARAVRALQDAVDVIVVESALLLPAVRVARPHAPIVWDTNECETLHYSRLTTGFTNRLRGLVWRLIERSSVARADVVVAISETEAGWWRRLFPASSQKLVVVDHCAPAVRVAPQLARAELDRLCGMTARGPVLLFVGNLLGKHNADAARWLLEELAPRLPAECTLVLAGPGTDGVAPPESTSALVCRLGAVPDIDAVIAGADLCLAPLAAGAGVKTKVLHYLAHGKLVIATPVALEGIEDAPGTEATTLADFPSAILGWIGRRDDPADRRREALQRAWLDARYGQARVADQWRDALTRAGVVLP